MKFSSVRHQNCSSRGFRFKCKWKFLVLIFSMRWIHELSNLIEEPVSESFFWLEIQVFCGERTNLNSWDLRFYVRKVRNIMWYKLFINRTMWRSKALIELKHYPLNRWLRHVFSYDRVLCIFLTQNRTYCLHWRRQSGLKFPNCFQSCNINKSMNQII